METDFELRRRTSNRSSNDASQLLKLIATLVIFCACAISTSDAQSQGLQSPYETPPQAQPPVQVRLGSPPPVQMQLGSQPQANTIPQPAPIFQNPMEPSPLSQYSTEGGVMQQISKLNGSQLLTGGEVLYTKKVNFGPSLQKYAALKQCSLNEAFAKATEFLRLSPRDVPKGDSVGASAYYQIVDKDVLHITAPKKFFDKLALNLQCIENGIRYIEMQILFVQIPVDHKTNVRRWIVPGSHVAFNNKIPQATPFATQETHATYRSEAISRNSSPGQPANDTTAKTFVMASETVTKAFPTIMARLDAKGVEGFRQYMKANPDRTATLAPTIRVVPGLPATITDGATRPFVVGVNRVEGDFTSAHRPIVQPIEEGTMLKVRAVGENGKIRLDGDLALSEIESVETYTYDEMRSKDPTVDQVTIQVPEHRLRQVHISTLVEEGKTVFIEAFGPTSVNYRLPKRPLAKEGRIGKRKVRSIILLTPKWVNVDEAKQATLTVKKR